MALASCSQKEEGVTVAGNPKAVTVSFANVTRSVGDKVDKDKTALYEDFYVLFTDDAGKIYKGKSADLTTDAPIYFANAAAAGDMTFHLLDNSVKKVYVIANPTDEIKTAADAATGINEIESVVVAAAAQQSVNPNDNADLVLYGVCESLVDAGTAEAAGSTYPDRCLHLRLHRYGRHHGLRHRAGGSEQLLYDLHPRRYAGRPEQYAHHR